MQVFLPVGFSAAASVIMDSNWTNMCFYLTLFSRISQEILRALHAVETHLDQVRFFTKFARLFGWLDFQNCALTNERKKMRFSEPAAAFCGALSLAGD